MLKLLKDHNDNNWIKKNNTCRKYFQPINSVEESKYIGKKEQVKFVIDLLNQDIILSEIEVLFYNVFDNPCTYYEICSYLLRNNPKKLKHLKEEWGDSYEKLKEIYK